MFKKGEWKVAPEKCQGGYFIYPDNKNKKRKAIAFVYPNGDGLEANARLIAAAPDMYEAIKTAIAELADAQGEWVSVSDTFAPSWTHPIKGTISALEGIFAEAGVL